MRLIDADVLINRIVFHTDFETDVKELFEDEINSEPTIESQRKKGKWIPQNLNKSDGMISTAVYYYPKCSVCGANANYTNFCPNCGAEMREPEDIPMEYFESGGKVNRNVDANT